VDIPEDWDIEDQNINLPAQWIELEGELNRVFDQDEHMDLDEMEDFDEEEAEQVIQASIQKKDLNHDQEMVSVVRYMGQTSTLVDMDIKACFEMVDLEQVTAIANYLNENGIWTLEETKMIKHWIYLINNLFYKVGGAVFPLKRGNPQGSGFSPRILNLVLWAALIANQNIRQLLDTTGGKIYTYADNIIYTNPKHINPEIIVNAINDAIKPFGLTLKENWAAIAGNYCTNNIKGESWKILGFELEDTGKPKKRPWNIISKPILTRQPHYLKLTHFKSTTYRRIMYDIVIIVFRKDVQGFKQLVERMRIYLSGYLGYWPTYEQIRAWKLEPGFEMARMIQNKGIDKLSNFWINELNHYWATKGFEVNQTINRDTYAEEQEYRQYFTHELKRKKLTMHYPEYRQKAAILEIVNLDYITGIPYSIITDQAVNINRNTPTTNHKLKYKWADICMAANNAMLRKIIFAIQADKFFGPLKKLSKILRKVEYDKVP
jgi:hypothetical protein